MADSNEAYDMNYFFRDYVTEDILSYCIGDTYLYHYKETIIGVRDVTTKLGFFVDINSIPKTDSPFAPTLDMLTSEHIKEAIDEIDHSDEKLEYIPIRELVLKAKEMVTQCLARELDKQFGVTAD